MDEFINSLFEMANKLSIEQYQRQKSSDLAPLSFNHLEKERTVHKAIGHLREAGHQLLMLQLAETEELRTPE